MLQCKEWWRRDSGLQIVFLHGDNGRTGWVRLHLLLLEGEEEHVPEAERECWREFIGKSSDKQKGVTLGQPTKEGNSVNVRDPDIDACSPSSLAHTPGSVNRTCVAAPCVTAVLHIFSMTDFPQSPPESHWFLQLAAAAVAVAVMVVVVREALLKHQCVNFTACTVRGRKCYFYFTPCWVYLNKESSQTMNMLYCTCWKISPLKLHSVSKLLQVKGITTIKTWS